jgi:hypothetical protein
MNTSYGWIKLHRNLLRHPLWEVSTAEQKVGMEWTALLLRAWTNDHFVEKSVRKMRQRRDTQEGTDRAAFF